MSTVALVGWATLGTALVAAWYAMPRYPPLDGERWFKALLYRSLRAAGHEVGSVELAWSPLGRWAERKLVHPGVESIPGAALPGEAALVAALAELVGPSERFDRLYGDSVDGLVSGDEVAALDPARWLGPGRGWGCVDAGGIDQLVARAERRMDARWLVLTTRDAEPSELTAALRAWGQHVDVTDWLSGPEDPTAAGEPEATEDALGKQLFEALTFERPQERLLVAAVGPAIVPLLRCLVARADLRDRVLAVLSVGGPMLGVPGGEGWLDPATCDDWMARNLRHGALDVEVVREIGYLGMQWLERGTDPPSGYGVPVQRARFPDPTYDGAEPATLVTVDLGVLPAPLALPAHAVASSLRAVAALWALTRR